MSTSPSPILLGIDAGQTVTKAVLFDLDLRELGTGSARVSTTSPRPRWVERDMDEVWAASVAAVRRAMSAADVDGRRIRGVGLVGHNDGVYPIDASGRPVRPAVTAMDTRAVDVLACWRGTPVWQRALELTGQVPYAASPASLLAWFAEQEPESLERSRWLLFCKDWLRFRLTGVIATDPSEASASFTAVQTQDYVVEALELYGLGQLYDRLPPIRPSAEIAGRISAEASAETGLPIGTPVVTGAHDVDGTALGTGVVEPGRLSIIAGTFSINQVLSDHVRVATNWQARSFVQPGRWLNMSTSPSSATNLEWLVEVLGLPSNAHTYSALLNDAAEVMAGPSSVIFHPFLYGSAYGAQASGAFLGLRGWHGRGELVRAVLEGVVLGHRVHIDQLRAGFDVGDAARLTGGAARNPVWAQLYADGLGMTMQVPDSEESGARGAAQLAGLGVGVYSSLQESAATVGVLRTFLPDPSRQEALDTAYEVFTDTASALAAAWLRLG